MPTKPEYVRVRAKDTGAELSVARNELDLNADAYEVLGGKDAFDSHGDLAATKPRVAKKAAARSTQSTRPAVSEPAKDGQQAEPTKEES